MSAILNSLNVHNFLIFQPISMTLVSKFMVYIALSDKTYILLVLRSPLIPGMTVIFSDDDFTTTAHSEAAYLACIRALC